MPRRETSLAGYGERPGTGRPRGGSFVALAVFLLGLPFARGGAIDWHLHGLTVLAGAGMLAAVGLRHTAQETSWRDAARLFTLAFALSWAAEASGVHHGFPFGARYLYEDDLRPFLPGGVPVFIPLAWFVILRVPLVLLRALPVRRANGSRAPGRVLAKALAGAAFLGASGLLLDPIGVRLSAWVWAEPGGWFGSPPANVAGWAAVGLAVYLPFFAGQDRPTDAVRTAGSDRRAVITWLAFVGLALAAAAFRLDHPAPALIAMVAMTPYVVFWIWSRLRRAASGAAPFSLPSLSARSPG
jgi:uncharacterized membrane protein